MALIATRTGASQEALFLQRARAQRAGPGWAFGCTLRAMDLTASADAVITAQTAPNPSALSLRRVAIDTYRENVAYLHRDCAIYRAEGFQALSKIEVRANGRRILASLNVVDDHSIVGCHELGLSEDAFLQLDVQNGHTASVAQAEAPASIEALRRKLAGERLGRENFAPSCRTLPTGATPRLN